MNILNRLFNWGYDVYSIGDMAETNESKKGLEKPRLKMIFIRERSVIRVYGDYNSERLSRLLDSKFKPIPNPCSPECRYIWSEL
jgi:hypothetical protein|tara:strand:- start:40 stop:291 length:252 start_codon:yes stop_codon:yes gene_type:complete